MKPRSAPSGRQSAARRWVTVLAGAALLVSACGSADEDATGAADDSARATTEQPSPAPPPPPPPPPAPEQEPAYAPPSDWQERALATAETARAAVVAVGWRPPTMVIRRLEAGWLIAPDLVVTSADVACEAQLGTGLRVRTFDGEFREATVEEVTGPCDPWEPGIAVLRLARPVDAPTLRIAEPRVLDVGEPVLAIGHSNWSAAVGGWLVLAGPVVEQDARWIWTDIGATVNYRRTGEFFGGGSSGAPVIDLDGDVITVLCCERDWGPQISLFDTPRSEPLLRRRLIIDEPYFVGGMPTATLRSALTAFVGTG